MELGRIFVDEYGFGSEVKVESADKTTRVTFKNAIGSTDFAKLKERGVEKLFSHPFLCTGIGALTRMGLKARGNVEIDKATNTQTITFELL